MDGWMDLWTRDGEYISQPMHHDISRDKVDWGLDVLFLLVRTH